MNRLNLLTKLWDRICQSNHGTRTSRRQSPLANFVPSLESLEQRLLLTVDAVAVSLSNVPDTVEIGGTITVTVKVRNDGNQTINNYFVGFGLETALRQTLFWKRKTRVVRFVLAKWTSGSRRSI